MLQTENSRTSVPPPTGGSPEQSPALSVIIPAYNMAGPLRRCLQAVRASTVPLREIIVVDDASTDETAEVARAFGCRVVRLPANRGPAAARNAGAAVASGELLLFVDADTAMFPSTIAQALATLQESGADAVCGAFATEPLNPGFFPRYAALLKHESHGHRVRPYNVFASQCGLIRRTVFQAAGGFTPFRPGVDIENEEFGRRVAARWRLVLDPAVQVRHQFSAGPALAAKWFRRAFWWTRYFLRHRTFEPVLMTPRVAVGTLMGPGILGAAGAAVALSGAAAHLALAGLGAALLLFWRSYGDLVRLAHRDGGWGFAAAVLIATLGMSCVVSAGALAGLVSGALPLRVTGAAAPIPETVS